MSLLTKILVFLIHIDQESILNFFGITDPNAVDPDFQMFYKTMEMAPVSTKVSYETLRLIVEAFLDYSKNGLSLVDIENICLFITFIRFIFLAIKYNIKTSFYICCISLFAAGLWYFHSKDILFNHQQIIQSLRIPGLTRARMETVSGMESDIRLFKGSLVNAYRKRLALGAGLSFDDKDVRSAYDFFSIKFALVKPSEQNGYRMDPISMIFSYMPNSVKPITDKIYYAMFDRVLPNTVNYFIRTFKSLLPIAAWSFATRIGKKYCPYLIRWHWTFLQVFEFIEMYIFQLVTRISIYGAKLEFLEIKYTQRTLLKVGVKWIFYLEFLFIFYGLIHALFSQYFYIPLLTENTEMHIGPRMKSSIYSGGYTDWQEYKEDWTPYGVEGRTKPRTVKLWYGWFGTDRQIPQKIRRFFKKFLKKIRKILFK